MVAALCFDATIVSKASSALFSLSQDRQQQHSAKTGSITISTVESAGQRNSMRNTHKRTAVKRDYVFVDVDSDELEQMMEEDTPASRKKQINTKRQKTPAAAANDDEYCQPDGGADGVIDLTASEADSAAADVNQVPEDSADSDSDASSDPDEGYHCKGTAKGKQQAGKRKQRADEKKPRKKRVNKAPVCHVRQGAVRVD
jgi:hypothetical protein